MNEKLSGFCICKGMFYRPIKTIICINTLRIVKRTLEVKSREFRSQSCGPVSASREGTIGRLRSTCLGGMSYVPRPQPEGGSRSGGWFPKQHGSALHQWVLY